MELVAVHPHRSPPIVLSLPDLQLGRVRECKVLDPQVSRKQCKVVVLRELVVHSISNKYLRGCMCIYPFQYLTYVRCPVNLRATAVGIRCG